MELQRGTCVLCTVNSKVITPPQGEETISLVKCLLPQKINTIEFSKLQSTFKVCPSCLHNILEANKTREKIKKLKNGSDSRRCLLCRSEQCLLQTTDNILSLIENILDDQIVDKKKKSVICVDCYVYLDTLHNLHTKLTYKYPILNADQKIPTSKKNKTEESTEKKNGKKNSRSSQRSSKESQKKEKDHKRRSGRAGKDVPIIISSDEDIPEPKVRVNRSGVKTTNIKQIGFLGHLLPLRTTPYYLQKYLKTDLKLINQVPYVKMLSYSLPVLDNKTTITRVNRKRKHDVIESENINKDIPSPNSKTKSSPSFFKIRLKSQSSKKKPSARSPSVTKKIGNLITKELVVRIAKLKNLDSSFRTPTKASKKLMPSSSTSDYDTPSSSKKRKSVSFAEEKNVEIEYGEYVPKKLAEENDETPQKSLKPLLKKSIFILDENGISSNDEDMDTSVSNIIRQLDDEDENNGIVNEDSPLEKNREKKSIAISDSEEDFETEKHENDRQKRFRRNKINIIKSNTKSESGSENEDNTVDEMQENHPKDKTNNKHRKKIKDKSESSDEELQGKDKTLDEVEENHPKDKTNNKHRKRIKDTSESSDEELQGKDKSKDTLADTDLTSKDTVDENNEDNNENLSKDQDSELGDKNKEREEENKDSHKSRKPGPLSKKLKRREKEISSSEGKNAVLDSETSTEEKTKTKFEHKSTKPGPLSKKLHKNEQTNDKDSEDKSSRKPDETETKISKENKDGYKENTGNSAAVDQEDLELDTTKEGDDKDKQKGSRKLRKPGPLSKKHKIKEAEEKSDGEEVHTEENASEARMEPEGESSNKSNEGDVEVDKQDKETSSVRRKPGPLSKKLKRKSKEPEVEVTEHEKFSAGGYEENPKKRKRDNSPSDSDSDIKKSKRSKNGNLGNEDVSKPNLNDSDLEENITEVNKYKDSKTRPRRTSNDSNDSTGDEFEFLIRDKQESLFDRLTNNTTPNDNTQKIGKENVDLGVNKEGSNCKDDLKKSDEDTEVAKDEKCLTDKDNEKDSEAAQDEECLRDKDNEKDIEAAKDEEPLTDKDNEKDSEAAKDEECLTGKDNEIVDVDKDDSENEKQEDAENECQIVDSNEKQEDGEKSDLLKSRKNDVEDNTVNDTINNEDSSNDCVLVENNLEEPPKESLDTSLRKTGDVVDKHNIAEDSKVNDGKNIEEQSDTNFTDKL